MQIYKNTTIQIFYSDSHVLTKLSFIQHPFSYLPIISYFPNPVSILKIYCLQIYLHHIKSKYIKFLSLDHYIRMRINLMVDI